MSMVQTAVVEASERLVNESEKRSERTAGLGAVGHMHFEHTLDALDLLLLRCIVQPAILTRFSSALHSLEIAETHCWKWSLICWTVKREATTGELLPEHVGSLSRAAHRSLRQECLR